MTVRLHNTRPNPDEHQNTLKGSWLDPVTAAGGWSYSSSQDIIRVKYCFRIPISPDTHIPSFPLAGQITCGHHVYRHTHRYMGRTRQPLPFSSANCGHHTYTDQPVTGSIIPLLTISGNKNPIQSSTPSFSLVRRWIILVRIERDSQR